MKKRKAVIVCTAHRGVFFGHIEADQANERTLRLENARMAIYWGTTKGVMQLAATGPTEKSVIGAPATIEALHDVTSVIAVTKEAEAVWMAR